MSYYASGEGYIQLKFEVPQLPDAIYQKLTETFSHVELSDDFDHAIELYFDGRYRSVVENDSLEDVLDSLNPFITEGYLKLQGEDEYTWKYIYNPKANCWDEFEARTVWSDESGLSPGENKVVKEALEKLGTDDAKAILERYTASFRNEE